MALLYLVVAGGDNGRFGGRGEGGTDLRRAAVDKPFLNRHLTSWLGRAREPCARIHVLGLKHHEIF